MPSQPRTHVHKALLGLAGLGLLLGACSRDPTDTAASPQTFPSASELGQQTVKPVAEYLADAPYATASNDLGERLLMQCRACHSLEDGAGHRLGPNLFGMFGRPVGSADGFGYTRALRDASFVWTPRALDAWLAQPQRFLPGNAMAFGGLSYADDRAAVIASLLRHTAAAAPH